MLKNLTHHLARFRRYRLGCLEPGGTLWLPPSGPPSSSRTPSSDVAARRVLELSPTSVFFFFGTCSCACLLAFCACRVPS